MLKPQRLQENSWISLSDIMTGLMIVFLFIAISYILEVQKKQTQRDQLIKDFEETKATLYKELNDEFNADFQKWKVIFDRDLSIKFTNPNFLFQTGSTSIEPSFRTILDQFLPRYFNILLATKYANRIGEIRVEGHTDTVAIPQYDSDPYIANVILSQLRSTEVVKFFRKSTYYNHLADTNKRRVQFLLTSNGLSYGRTLDGNANLTFFSGLPPNNNLSRRVEFKVVTTSEKLIEEIIKEMKQ